ncbi:MAG: MFS transporter [Peptococcaceae bacterium]|jgi:EmrB/QacA subfamily drug resistance transporter|nr:MFS transporter [Peptococcaceae bacterium]
MAEATAAGSRKKWLILCVTFLGSICATINASIINLANPTLAREFHIGIEQVQWISTIFLIVMSSLMLLFGRVGDRIGSYKIYIAGLVIFILGSLSCGLSGGFALLLVSRAVQAVGSAMMLATGMAIIATTFPLAERGKALGLQMIAIGVGNMCGPSAGGFILSYFTWPYIFYVNIPFGLLALILAIRVLRSPVPEDRSNFPPLDYLGSLLLAIMICALILFLSGGFPHSQWFALLFILTIPVFFWYEKRHPEPMWNYELFKNPRFALGNLIAFLSYFAHMSVFFLVPFYMEDILGVPTYMVALTIMISPLIMSVSSPIFGNLSDKVGGTRIMPMAFVVMLISFLILLTTTDHSPIWRIGLALFCMGGGMGMLNTPNNSEIMTAAGKRYTGYASGFVATARNLAFCVGTAFSASIFSILRRVFAQHQDPKIAYMNAFHCLALSSAVICVVVLVISLRLHKQQVRMRESSDLN